APCAARGHVSLASFLPPVPPGTATSTLSLHDALPICLFSQSALLLQALGVSLAEIGVGSLGARPERNGDLGERLLRLPHLLEERSEEHTSELQSRENLVCRLLLEKKKENAMHALTLYS